MIAPKHPKQLIMKRRAPRIIRQTAGVVRLILEKLGVRITLGEEGVTGKIYLYY